MRKPLTHPQVWHPYLVEVDEHLMDSGFQRENKPHGYFIYRWKNVTIELREGRFDHPMVTFPVAEGINFKGRVYNHTADCRLGDDTDVDYIKDVVQQLTFTRRLEDLR